MYGGECPCVSETTGLARVTGRQCDSCPYTTYLTPGGCVGEWGGEEGGRDGGRRERGREEGKER